MPKVENRQQSSADGGERLACCKRLRPASRAPQELAVGGICSPSHTALHAFKGGDRAQTFDQQGREGFGRITPGSCQLRLPEK